MSDARATRRVVILGTSLTGMLAAAALAPHADEVIIMDRDDLPDGPMSRPGLPQAHHAHLLWSGGEEAMEQIAPGMQQLLIQAGARYVPMPGSLLTLTPHGWVPRTGAPMQHQIVCSRDFLDATARGHLLKGVTVRSRVYAEALTGTPKRITGVRVRDLETKKTEDVSATLVVDATGRKSHAARWLEEIGLPAVVESIVDPGLVYASRWFRAPDGAEEYPVISLQPDPGLGKPGRIATLVPVEGGRWLVTLAGTLGAQPSADTAAFESFARSAAHPLVADLIARAEPLSDVRLYRNCRNHRRYFERLKPWPAGIVVLGDAVVSTNPIYGQGMTMAAQMVLAMRTALLRHGLADPDFSSTVQRRIGRVVQAPWDITTGQDIRFPGATGPRASLAGRLTHRYVDRLSSTAMSRPKATKALFDVMSLAEPPTRLFRPDTVWEVIKGPAGPALGKPPMTDAERAYCSPLSASIRTRPEA
ncbi:NAD(P)/FAD-dependent oxidoreductase [Streptomyces sp. NPDC091259]|uniref:NAD(P)/FAD-dependent oxidoreductase n=1 Tax=Streptomyces sp. NPDC091259 TaxID=3365976 RepID=UPI0038287B59